jgi:hypothetical protein
MKNFLEEKLRKIFHSKLTFDMPSDEKTNNSFYQVIDELFRTFGEMEKVSFF